MSKQLQFFPDDHRFMRLALRLARRGYGQTSPNPIVGAVLVKGGKVIGRGWHRRAGEPHAEIEALRDAERRKIAVKDATLYVTLEPCCTHGRTPPCTEALRAARLKRVIFAARDPNPDHQGNAARILKRAGIDVRHGLLSDEAGRLNEPFNHWIVQQTPFVTVKAAMSLDGKIATSTGESKWITGPQARKEGMQLRLGADAILVGVNTILLDDPGLTLRLPRLTGKILRRIVLDPNARTPLKSKVLTDADSDLTTIVVTKAAPKAKVARLAGSASVWVAPARRGEIDLKWLLRRLGGQGVTHLLVEGGGETNARFLLGGFAQRVAFFYGPKIIGGGAARRSVAGQGARRWQEILSLDDVRYRRLGPDVMMTARVARPKSLA